LAFLAAELQSGGHFDKIIVMIDRMVSDLRVEEADDIKAKDVCEGQENDLKAQQEDLEYNIKKKGDAKKRLTANQEDVEKKIEATKSEIEGTKGTMSEVLDARNEENSEFKQALKDDTDAIALLQQAIGSLTAFYTNNKLPLALVQEPEYTVDEDKAPDASFSSPGRKSESTGIIQILSMLKEDLEMEIKTARAEEAEAQAEYEKQRGELNKSLDAQTKTENTLDGEQADLSGKIADTEGEIANHEEMKGNTIDEKEALKPSCDWVKEHFEPRREKRKTEIEGLQEAKAILAGAAAPEFLQKN